MPPWFIAMPPIPRSASRPKPSPSFPPPRGIRGAPPGLPPPNNTLPITAPVTMFMISGKNAVIATPAFTAASPGRPSSADLIASAPAKRPSLARMSRNAPRTLTRLSSSFFKSFFSSALICFCALDCCPSCCLSCPRFAFTCSNSRTNLPNAIAVFGDNLSASSFFAASSLS